MQRCEWIFDFYAIAFDYLSERVAATETELSHLKSLAESKLRQEIRSHDGGIPARISDFLGIPGSNWAAMTDAFLETRTFHMKLLYVLWQIDRAAVDLNYFRHSPSRGFWMATRQHMEANRLDLGRDFKKTVRIRAPRLDTMNWWEAALDAGWSILERGQNLDRFFQNLVRVPEVVGAQVELMQRVPSLFDRFTADPGKNQLRVAVVPLVDDLKPRSHSAELIPGPLHIVPRTISPDPPSPGTSGRVQHRFGIDVVPGTDPTQTMEFLAGHAEYLTKLACEEHADLLLFPELVVPDAVVAAIQKTLRHYWEREEHTPYLTLAGTFGRISGTDKKAYNEAIILDNTGAELYHQRKMHAYKMFEYEQGKYDLAEVLGNVPRQEDFETFPRRIIFLDSRAAGYRVVTLICEDAAQANPGRGAISALQPTLVFVPVMAGALEKGCWCWETASHFAGDPGAVTVIANSGGLAKSQYRKQGRTEMPPLAILASPLADPKPTFSCIRNQSPVAAKPLIIIKIP